jgi:dienelactone hydrolase
MASVGVRHPHEGAQRNRSKRHSLKASLTQFAVALWLCSCSSNACCTGSSDDVSFPLLQNLAQPTNAWAGKPITLTGEYVPAAPHSPAIIIMNGSSGLEPRYALPMARSWAAWFRAQGFTTLIMDSYKPRGMPDIIHYSLPLYGGDPNNWFTEYQRSEDPVSAYQWLVQQPAVDPKRVYVIGFSHGGGTVLQLWARPEAHLFAGLIDFYGWCESSQVQLALLDPAAHTEPLLVFVGANDDKGFVDCSRRLLTRSTVKGYVFPNTDHNFDYPYAQYNGAALAQSRQMIEMFVSNP